MLSFAVYNGIENINWTMIFLTTCNKISKIILVSGVTFVFMYQSVHTFLKSFSTIFFFVEAAKAAWFCPSVWMSDSQMLFQTFISLMLMWVKHKWFEA